MAATNAHSITKKLAVVTGANKGIGLEICRQLACKGVMVILTARDVKRGTQAVEKLKEEYGLSDVVFHQLDVTDSASVDALAEFIKQQFGKLDILVNNAGINGAVLDPQDFDSAKQECVKQGGVENFFKLIDASVETYENTKACLDINFFGTKRVTEALIPFLQLSQSPRIVNLTSAFGKLQFIPSESIKRELKDVNSLTAERLKEIIQSFIDAAKENTLEANGWPPSKSGYIVSKIAVNIYTAILAKEYTNFCVNCVDPGFVKTDMNWNTGVLTVEQGAQGPVMLAELPDGSPSGLYYNQMEVSTFE